MPRQPTIDNSNSAQPSPSVSHGRRAIALAALAVALATLACGSFVPRPTPVPRPSPTVVVETGVEQQPTATPLVALATSVPTRVVPTPTFTPTPVPGTELIVGQPARVSAAQGLNARKTASVSGERVGRYPPGAIVSILEGPETADGYRWWRVGNNELSGWVADGDADSGEEWLSPKVGSTQPVNRAVKLGDEVVVTVGAGGLLKVRAQAGLSSPVEHQIPENSQLSIVEGPVEANGYRWWKVSDGGSVSGWAAEGNSTDRWLTPLE
ncbi:MAG: SH3 domain-containing protein [Anaerolineae bacterium]|nr:SH3 domain-containing protein [Anaerolineae bacterium]